MTVYPSAKINIGLFITEKRSDGFHNIETVFYPIPLCDRLDIEIADTTEKVNFECIGMDLSSDNPFDNLCCKAYRLLDTVYDLPPVNIRLHKMIPIGAGLGGGSSDAAYTLRTLNQLCHLQISEDELATYASHLGSDCSFFLRNSPALGTGKGDILAPMVLSLAEYALLLVKPSIFVSTAEAYSDVYPRLPKQHLSGLLQKPMIEWRRAVFNDFEESVFAKFPEIRHIKEHMYAMGAIYASMSGSGSSVYGFFKHIPENTHQQFPGCFVWSDTTKL